MDLHVMLPWELEEDILSRLPPKSLVRFRVVSKRWDSLFKDKSFINKHLSLSRPQFILLTKSNIYSIDIIDERINLRELHSSCSRDLSLQYGTNITTYDNLLFSHCSPHWEKGTALWNPWLRQVNLIKFSLDKEFIVFGLGYNSSGPQKFHKILIYIDYSKQKVGIYECVSQALRFIDTRNNKMPITRTDKRLHVSLNGDLYWISYNRLTHEYFIRSFDFTKEIFKPFCLLPCQDSHSGNEHFLAVYKGDRFSLLRRSNLTSKIEIWVMKNKIDDKEEVVWSNLMTLTASNLPKFFDKIDDVSYFIYDKTLFICCGDDGSRHLCIYIAKGDMCNKIQIGYGKTSWFSHCAYVPNLNSVPLEFHTE